MERLIGTWIVLGALVSCTPQGQDVYNAWNSSFAHVPLRFSHSVTALWIATYQEDPQTHRFVRTMAWGEVPEKLVADAQGGYSVAVPLLAQSETSDGPMPDQFRTVLVRVFRSGDEFTLVDNEALPGPVAVWHDVSHRTVWFRGKASDGPQQTLWQFKGRY